MRARPLPNAGVIDESTRGPYAGVVELADTPDLGSGAVRFGGSSPPSRISQQHLSNGADAYCDVSSSKAIKSLGRSSPVRFPSSRTYAAIALPLWLAACSPWHISPPFPYVDQCPPTAEAFATQSVHVYEQFKRSNRSGFRSYVERVQELGAQRPGAPTKHLPTITWEEGDQYPVIRLSHGSSFRLTPVMRRVKLDVIERIAINPNSTAIALIARRLTDSTHRLLIIDPKATSAEEIDIDAYDVSWVDDSTVLISARISQEPRAILSMRLGEPPQEIVRAQQRGEHLLLRPSAAQGYGLIEHAHPLWSSFDVITASAPYRPRQINTQDAPGSSCAVMGDSAFCSSFLSHPRGSITRIDLNTFTPQQTVYVESVGASIAHIAPTNEGLAIFTSHGTYSTVSVISSTGQLIRPPRFDGPTATLMPAPRTPELSDLAVIKRSFLRPTTRLSMTEVSGASVPAAAKECDRCIESALNATSADGTLVPISLALPPEPKGLLLKAYGSYGVSSSAEHSPELISLLQQGIAVAIAHVRGGGERGPLWHSSALGPNKLRSVEDLSACVTELRRTLRLPPERIILSGRSAGAWLAAKTALSYPEKLGGLILEAPLLDLEHIVPDKALPIFDREQYEWGDSLSVLRDLSPALTTHELPLDVLALVPMQDELVPPQRTLQWLRDFHCRQSPTSRTVVSLVPGVGHAGPTTKTLLDEWNAVQEAFIQYVVTNGRQK